MRTVGEIELPAMKPAMEWIRGRAIQKMSPTFSHGILQGAFLLHLGAWAQGRGRVVPEWRFRVTLPGGQTHPLVPDLAYMSFERLRTLTGKALEHPAIPPEIVVEIKSPDDARADVDAKIDEYLAWGVSLVLVADPVRRRMNAYEASATQTDLVDRYTTPLFTDLALPLSGIFAELDIPRA